MSKGQDKSSLWHWLESAGLEKYYNSFRNAGVTEENLIDLQFQDYDALGVIEHTDRHNLFSLIRVVKRELEENGLTPAAQQQPVAQAPVSARQPAPAAASASRAAPKSRTPAVAPAPVQPAPVQQPVKREEERIDRTVPRAVIPPASEVLPDDDYGDINDDEEDAGPVEPLPTGDGGQYASKIRVAVRKRPLNKNEKGRNELDIATVNKKNYCVTIHEPKQKVDLTKYVENHDFAFDEVFGENSSNEEIYAVTCKPLINFFINKGKATCFAYGQTGSGKTFTMMGPGGGKEAQVGLYVLAARDIFRQLASDKAYSGLQVWVSFFEIYGGKLFDLCNDRKKLVCREDAQKSVNIVGLKERRCENVNDLLELMAYGNTVRSTGVTGANIDSSRSHAILQIALKKVVKSAHEKARLKVHGKFSFIDLAGSERAADTTNNDRQTRLEGAEINKSLLALKECIRALDQNSKHMPFRGSQLTQVLKDSFVGNSRTIMIANISPNSGSCEHTLNTLRYADRVKELKKPPTTGAAGAAAVAAANQASSASKPAHNAYMPHRGKVGKIRNVALDKMDRDDEDGGEAKEDAYESDLVRTHHDLCSAILKEEETIVEAHREQIDAMMKLIKEEMELLKKFDVLGYSVDEYVGNLDEILANKIAHITDLRNKLAVFKSHLKEEEALSNSFSRQNNNNNNYR